MDIKFNPDVLRKLKYEHKVDSDKELAELLGVEPSTIFRWKKHQASPNWAATARMVSLGLSWSEMAMEADALAKAA
ncbi:helix-turn-helix domain-containing protein [Rothia terrae]|uniref:helix-turn-helix domain-containing protein n=1 Tax=Rothia terrae TaxID=396015 RepID=UPI0037F63F93